MAKTQDFPNVTSPVIVADNRGRSATKTFVITNLHATRDGEILGIGESLGQGTPLLASDRFVCDLGDDALCVAAASAIGLRVLSFYPARQ